MRDFVFVRRYLSLDIQKKSFQIKRDVSYKCEANTCEEALITVIQQIDSREGRQGVLLNNGFPDDCVTSDSQSLYVVSHSMASLIYQQEIEETGQQKGSFLEELAKSKDFNIDHIYQGFYADGQLLYPRALNTHRLQCREEEFNYLFEIEGGRNNGEYEKYLFYNKVLYKGSDLLYCNNETFA